MAVKGGKRAAFLFFYYICIMSKKKKITSDKVRSKDEFFNEKAAKAKATLKKVGLPKGWKQP